MEEGKPSLPICKNVFVIPEGAQLEYEIIDGYYFNDGFNKKIVESIKFLFNERVELKKVENNIILIFSVVF